MNNIQLVIPMAGASQRFKDQGYKTPKPFIDVDGKPMIEHVVSLFPGVTDVVFICPPLDGCELDVLSPLGKVIEICAHNEGPVYSVMQAASDISDEKEIIVSYCDYGTKWDFDKFLLTARNGDFDGALACYKGFHPHMLGSDNYAFCREEDNILLEIKEKEPFTDDRMSEFASNGTYYFKSGALLKKYFQEAIDSDVSVNGEHYVSLVYNLLIRDGLRSVIFEIEKMLQWGTPEDLEIYKKWSRYFRQPKFTLILPMAGKSQRFKDAGYDIPKPFLPVNDKPMLIESVKCLPQYEEAIFICLKQHRQKVLEATSLYFDNTKVYTIDSATEGQACTCEIGIKNANIDLDSPILISACDNGMVYDQQRFFDMINDQDNDIIVWSFRNHPTSRNNPDMYAWLAVDKDGYIYNVSCKKFIFGRSHAIIGTMYFRKARYFLDGLKANYEQNIRTNGEFYVDDVLNQNIKQGLTLKVFEVDNYICWGTPDDYNTYVYWYEYFNKGRKYGSKTMPDY